jgi:hypothetical protein
MDNYKNIPPYTFVVDFTSGLKVSCFDNYDPENTFSIRVYIKKSKINNKLKWSYNESGGHYVESETINSDDFLILWGEQNVKSNYFYWFSYKGFVPFYLEITDNKTKEIIYKGSFDSRHKLIDFTLHSDDPIVLHTWMCVLEKFKKETECQLSITNNYLKENQKYNFVDCYWNTEEKFDRFYAGYDIGRFGTEEAPHLFMNPDGIQGKNDLEIIEDILYHYSKTL